MDILEPFHIWQLKYQQKEHYGQLHDTFPAMDEQLGQLEESKQLYESISRRHDTQHIRTSIGAAWVVLNKYILQSLCCIYCFALLLANSKIIRYYTLSDLVPAHFAAIALHPEMQFKYFETEWESHSDWIQNAKAEVRKLWESNYKPPPPTPQEQRLRVAQYLTTTPATATPEGSVLPNDVTSESSTQTHILDWKPRKRQRLISSNRDDLDDYLRRDVEDEFPLGPLKYWIDHAEDLRQKDLAKMTLDIFSIPAMSADPERLFSRYDIS